jgi:peroxiredoxin
MRDSRFCFQLAAGLAAIAIGLFSGARAAQETPDPLAGYKGKILVLLAGSPDCPGTLTGTEFLTGYMKEKPQGVEVLRLDVPVTVDGTFAPVADLAIPRKVDTGRTIAQKLDFFYYPTIYLIDRDGLVRFSGECDPVKVKAMVLELAAEKPGAEKKMYTQPLLPAGKSMPAFAAKTLAGEEKKLDDLKGAKATLLFFGATTCPFSNDALSALPRIQKDYAPKGAGIAIVTMSPATAETKKFHDTKAPGVTALADPAGEIGTKLCHVPAVPFYYALDAKGVVALGQPFTDAAARAALDAILGGAAAMPPAPADGAG